MLTRRQFLKTGALGAGLFAIPVTPLRTALGAAMPRFAKVPHFTVPLPIPAKATPVAPNTFHIAQRPTQQILHPRLGQTTVWGYDDGTLGPLYPGPTIEVQKGVPTTVVYANQLPSTHLLPVDTSIVPGGDPAVRVLTHLHGGFVSGADDGNPFHTEFSNEYTQGQVQAVTYPNEQPAATLWYHDHALAITRLNVYAGLAGYYLIRDSDDTGNEPNPIGIPGGCTKLIDSGSGELHRTPLYYPARAGAGVSRLGRGERRALPFPGRGAAAVPLPFPERVQLAFLQSDDRRRTGLPPDRI
jgi:FtsP/CotA-like multicopper oxidase with cupredoxin domain